jgi:HK97 family phage major capsid protein
MNKKKLKDLFKRDQEITARMNEITDLCEKEGRVRNAEEDKEFQALIRERQNLSARMAAYSAQDLVERNHETRMREAETIIRENVESKVATSIVLHRDLIMVNDVEAGKIVPLKVQDILAPLEEGLILHQVGLPFLTGLAGEYVWPIYEAVEAQIADEGVALSDTKIEMSALKASYDRVGLAIPVTYQTIMQTEGIIETIIRTVMPKALVAILNKVTFSREKVNKATNLVGPFVNLEAKEIDASFKAFNLLKAGIYATGVDGENMAYVMSKATKAILEATPKDAGSGIMVCENDHIAGLPVFTTHYIGDGYVGLGDWKWQPMALFGDIRFTVDPYTLSRKGAVDFILEANYGTKTLRKEAFVLAHVADADVTAED